MSRLTPTSTRLVIAARPRFTTHKEAVAGSPARNLEILFTTYGRALHDELLAAAKTEHMRARFALEQMRLSTDAFESLDLALIARTCRERSKTLRAWAATALTMSL